MIELIVYHRPYNSKIKAAPTDDPSDPKNSILNRSSSPVPEAERAPGNYFTMKQNPANPVTPIDPIVQLPNPGAQGLRIDLGDMESFSLPINYNISDVREPDRKKTSWTKTLEIPGTRNNNRVFGHLYDMSKDGWVTIGTTRVYNGFNPGLRKDVILLEDGIQILKGSMQVLKCKRRIGGKNTYTIALSGDLTSLFFDVGEAKLANLPFDEWDHEWSKANIMNSWYGVLKKKVNNIDTTVSNVVEGTKFTAAAVWRHTTTGRLGVTTVGAHGFAEGDFVRSTISPIVFNGSSNSASAVANGTWCVAEVISATEFTFNTPYPLQLMSSFTYNPVSFSDTVPNGQVYKVSCTGEGYVYPLVSWGDEYDQNSFPVTSMAPSYFVKEIWDKIFDKTNSKYQSNFLDSQFFKRLLVTQKKTSYDLTQAEINSRKFYVGSLMEHTNVVSSHCTQWAKMTMVGAQTFNETSTSPGAHQQAAMPGSNIDQTAKYPFNIESGLIGSSNQFYGDVNDNFTDNTWTVRESSEYKINCVINCSSWMDMHSFDGVGTGATTSFDDYPPRGGNLPNDYALGPKPSTYYTNPFSGEARRYSLRVAMVLVRERMGNKTPSTLTTTDFYVGSQPFYTSPGNNGFPYFGRYYPAGWDSKTLNFSNSFFFSKGEKVWIEVHYYLACPAFSGGSAPYLCKPGYVSAKENTDDTNRTNIDFAGRWFLRTKGLSIFGNEPSPKSGENSIIYGKEFLPKDMTCKDFLKNIIKMFNLYITEDRYVDRLYYIEPRDDFYYDGSNGASDYVEWDDKAVGEFEAQPLGQLLGKNYVFQNKAETDYWNKRFKEEVGRDYMSYTYTIQNDFLKNDYKIDVTFGSTVMINNPENTDVVMPAVLQREANGSFKPSGTTAPRMLIWVGLRPYANKNGTGIPLANNPLYPSNFGWELLSSSTVVTDNAATASHLQLYPYAGTVDSPLEPFYDINWFNMDVSKGDLVYWDYARWTNNNLYLTYWKNYIDEVSDPSSMLLTVEVDLGPSDIANLDFRKIYVLNNNYYRLQKVVDYLPGANRLTKVELLKLKSPSKWTRRSINNGEYFEKYYNVDRVIDTPILIAPPRSKTWRDSSYGSNAPYSLGNGTITNNGLANHIGNGVRNLNLTGTECYIGDGSTNLNISGNGVNIAPNVKNVTVLGTDNITIVESNVSYINGTKYKDGIAITRCNFIDGGEITASQSSSLEFTRNKNSIINFIDGGEDDILEEGSQASENFIDGGKDVILNGVSDLGISTVMNTPTPRTNYSPGADVTSLTQSMVDFVRSAQGTT